MSFEVHRGEELRPSPAVDLHDIQATVLRYRPEPYFGTHFFLHINDAQGGREFLGRLAPHVSSAPIGGMPKTLGSRLRSAIQGSEHWACRKTRCKAFLKHFVWAWLRVLRSFVTTE